MRMTSFILMVLAATVMLVSVVLYAPIVPTVTLKPMPKSDRLPAIDSISAEDPVPPRTLSAENAAKLRRILHPICLRSLRSESEARKLGFRSDRVTKLCDCSVGVTVESAADDYRKEGFEDLPLVAGEDARKRRQLDDAQYLGIVAGLERACAAREAANAPVRR